MPFLEVVLEQSNQGQQVLNRWNYIAAGTPSIVSFSFALANAIGAVPTDSVYPSGGLMNLLRLAQDASVSFVNILVRNVYSNTDFYQTPFVPALSGNAGGSTLGPVPSFGFISNKTRYDIRRGQKRFVGVTASAMSADNTYSSAYNTLLGNIAAEMGKILEYDDASNILTFTPCIAKREKYEVPDSSPPRFAYRYFETESEQLENVMTSLSWTHYPTVRSQTSRQIGRGR